MSKISLKPNDSGTGTFTLESPNSNTNRTLTLPDEAGSVLTDVSDLAAANLTGDVAADRITGALNATGSAPVYACRAWVNFDGTGTVSIRASGNVSSITDNGTGDYTVNFTTAMPDEDYSWHTSSNSRSTTFPSGYDELKLATTSLTGSPYLKTPNQVRFVFGRASGQTLDSSYLSVCFFR